MLPARRLQQLMEHVVVLIGRLADFSTLHLLQLTVDDGGETVLDGDDGRGGIKCGWRLRAASFGFGYASRAASRVAVSRAPASAEVTGGASTSVSPALTAPMIGAKKL